MKALARKLRDWLNELLDESGNSGVGPGQGAGDPGASGAILSSRNREEPAVRPASEPKEEMGTPGTSAFDQPGPPEDWLRRVREAAPGLLLATGEGGMPSFRARPATIGEGQQHRDVASRPAVPVRAGEGFRRTEKSLGGPPSEKKNAWMQQLKRQFISPEARRAEQQGSPRSEYSPAQRQAERPAVFGRTRTEFSGEARPSQAPQLAALDLPHPSETHVRGAEPVALRWSERVRQKIQAAWQSFSGTWSSSTAPVQPVKAQSPNRPTVPALHKKASVRAGVEVDPGSLPLPRFRPAKRPATPDAHDRRPEQHRPLRNTSPSEADSPTAWRLAPRAHDDFANRNREANERGDVKEQGPSGIDDWGAAQRIDPRARTADDSPDSERREPDPWPELPESQPVSTAEWGQLLRYAERVRGLDLEQRGGR